MPPTSLLTLCMIVKNEASGIARTLQSVRPHLDRWLIVDTGSTDGTQDLVRSLMGELPGALHEHPFVDYATTRNLAMDLAGTDTTYLLWLDAEDELLNGEALREALEAAAARPGGPDAYYIRKKLAVEFDAVCLVRTAAHWRYRGVVHEVLMGPNGEICHDRLAGPVIRHERAPDSEERSRARWGRDAELLGGAVAQDPGDTRATFYLAQTLNWLGRSEEAIAMYERRIALGGWVEEVYYSRFMLAQVSERLGRPWAEVQQRYLDAFATSPHRAEPLCAIADHYIRTQAFTVAYLFARRAYELPYPERDRLFVDDAAYAWRAADLMATSAFYAGDFEAGERAARKALAACPDDARLQANLTFYLQRKG
jgi:glycosyltransferase involved in cell wall biosynthesis